MGGVVGLWLLLLFQGVSCSGPKVVGTGCAPDIPVCICDPTGTGCKEVESFSNAFADRPPVTLRAEFAATAGAPPLNPQVVRPQLLALRRKLGTKLKDAGMAELVVFARCEAQVCQGERTALLGYLRSFLKGSPDFLLEEVEELADLTVWLKRKGQQLVFEAVDREGFFGDAEAVVVRSTVDVVVLETEWAVVAVPTYEDDDNDNQTEAAPQHYQIQRRLVSRQQFVGSGGNAPQTNLNFEKAENHCKDNGAVLPNIQVLEYALRQGVIAGHRDSLHEMVRMTDEEDDYEYTLIHYDKHQFDFGDSAKRLTFNWHTGEYEEVQGVSRWNSLGFRCSRLEEVGQ